MVWEISRVGVVGCGLMGSGIVEVAARAGLEVNVLDLQTEPAMGNRRDAAMSLLSSQLGSGCFKEVDLRTESIVDVLGIGRVDLGSSIRDSDVRILRAVPMLEHIPEKDVQALIRSFSLGSALRGQTIFSEGDEDEGSIYVVLDGRVGLELRDDQDHATLLAVLGPSEMFGELSALDTGPRSSTATALTPARLAMLRADDLLDWATHRPVIARQLLRVVARRLRRANDTVAGLVFVDVSGRVARVVLDLADRFGEPAEHGLLVKHSLTQHQLAQLAGSSRETVNKVLASFASQGWLILERRSLVLRDIGSLRKRAWPSTDERSRDWARQSGRTVSCAAADRTRWSDPSVCGHAE